MNNKNIKPILFNADMVRAILDGRKTQTRRVVKPTPSDIDALWPSDKSHVSFLDVIDGANYYASCGYCPYGKVSDYLWVREPGWERPERTSKMLREGADTWPNYIYDADGCDHDQLREWGWKHRPSIHMPRNASRLTLEIVNVRIERVQDISEYDARLEGAKRSDSHRGYPSCNAVMIQTYKMGFRKLWDAINDRRGYSWAFNPWVWVIEFNRILP